MSAVAWVGAWCPQCGPNVACDEDGCCEHCGATATGVGADRALALTAAVDAVLAVSINPDVVPEALTAALLDLAIVRQTGCPADAGEWRVPETAEVER